MIYRLVAHFLWKVNLSQTYNGFIYSLQKVPYLGRYVKDSHYQPDVKQVMKAFQVLVLLVKRFLLMLVYLLSLILLASLWFHVQDGFFERFDLSSDLSQSYGTILKALIVAFSLLMSSLINTDLIEVNTFNKEQLAMIKVFRIEASVYYMVREVGKALNQYLTLGFGWALAFLFLDLPLEEALCFASLTVGGRVFIRSLMLRAYRPQSKIPMRYHNYLGFLAGGLGLIYLWISVAEGGVWLSQWAFAWWAGLLGILLATLGFYHLYQFKGLNRLASQLVSQSSVINWSETVYEANKIALQVKEKDLTYKGSIELGDSGGVAYLNKVFLSRLGRPLRKRVVITVLILLAMILALQFSFYLVEDYSGQLKGTIRFEQLLILSSLIGYMVYMGEHYMKYCFFHLDRHFLKFNYYRKPDFVRKTLKTRLGISIAYNFPICLALFALFATMTVNLYGLKWQQLGLLLIFQLMGMFFFSLHFLYLYFYLQPFTEQMQSRSHVYNWINQGTYAVFVLLLQFLPRLDLV